MVLHSAKQVNVYMQTIAKENNYGKICNAFWFFCNVSVCSILFGFQPENRLVMMDLSDMTVTVLKPAECAVRLVFLDCGITVTLNEDDRAKFIQVFTAVVKEEVNFA